MTTSCSCAFNSSMKVSDTNFCDVLVIRILRGQATRKKAVLWLPELTAGSLNQLTTRYTFEHDRRILIGVILDIFGL